MGRGLVRARDVTAPGEPTLGEIGRTLADVKEDIRALRGELVHREVYAADLRLTEVRQTATDTRIAALEARLMAADEERKGLRRMVLGAALTAGLAVLAQLIQGALQGAS